MAATGDSQRLEALEPTNGRGESSREIVAGEVTAEWAGREVSWRSGLGEEVEVEGEEGGGG